MFRRLNGRLGTSLRILLLSDNPRIQGPLPESVGSSEANNMSTIVMSNTSVTGPIPESWSNFPYLTNVQLRNTKLRATRLPSFVELGQDGPDIVNESLLCNPVS